MAMSGRQKSNRTEEVAITVGGTRLDQPYVFRIELDYSIERYRVQTHSRRKSMKKAIEKIDQFLSFSALPSMVEHTLTMALAIQQIPAPTFEEGRRAAYVADQFGGFGLEGVETDEVFNVYGCYPGADRTLRGVMVTAHTDIVFPMETDLTLRYEDEVIFGPGLGDNSIGVAGMLALIAFFRQEQITPPCDIWFVATTREEGLGDLGGMKAAYARLADRVRAVINVEGLAFGHIYRAGIAVRRLHIRAHTAGGHSWLHFGRASAIHGIMKLGAEIAAMVPPDSPRTTYNIGMIDGGQSINSIATEASLWLDLRSEAPQTLASMEAKVRSHVRRLSASDLTFDIEVVGDRPAGSIPLDHPLVLTAQQILAHLGIQGSLETGSTDGNVPLAAGCPTVTVGITRGGNAHRLDEYIEKGPIRLGLRQLILLTLAACEPEVVPV